ncbi:MAG: tartrate dehydrogenase [Desulfobacterales bacterium]|nr:tartrate dehydrogenase [Desulfobacterales bacterium]
MRQIHLKLIPGDGVGLEVIREGKRILNQIEKIHGGIKFKYDEYDWGCTYYLEHKEMMPKDGIKILSDCDCILLGAIGFPGVPDHISLRQLLLPIRQEFDQYINLRPIQLLEGLNSPIKVTNPKDIDFVVIRENSEGEYCGKGYVLNENTPDETVVQEAWFSRKGTARVIRYTFEYAVKRGLKKVLSATKSNALNYSMVFWDKIFNEIRTEYENIESESMHVDALAGLFIINPRRLDVVVASNLFGDILTDLGSAMLGSIGISPSANINPEKKYPSMFEPIHGSAPDIASKGIANPIGTIWSIALMLEQLELVEMSQLLMQAMGMVIKEKKVRTPDLGGKNTTSEVAEEICNKLSALSG